jgi:hypothetical protein
MAEEPNSETPQPAITEPTGFPKGPDQATDEPAAEGHALQTQLSDSNTEYSLATSCSGESDSAKNETSEEGPQVKLPRTTSKTSSNARASICIPEKENPGAAPTNDASTERGEHCVHSKDSKDLHSEEVPHSSAEAPGTAPNPLSEEGGVIGDATHR